MCCDHESLLSISTPRYLVEDFSEIMLLFIFNVILTRFFLWKELKTTTFDMEIFLDSLFADNQFETLSNSTLQIASIGLDLHD